MPNAPHPELPAEHESTAPVDFETARSMKRSLLAEIREGWNTGRSVEPEDLLCRWPTEPSRDPDAASVLFEDFCQRRARASESFETLDEYLEVCEKRFPNVAPSVRRLASRRALMASVDGESWNTANEKGILRLPDAGESLFGFQLLHELGSGSFAKVFLAEDTKLADRAVVVKVSAIEGDEPKTLAQMQHTHIVPIFSVQEDQASGLRAVCMPYFGGESLATLHAWIWQGGRRPKLGNEWNRALHACHRIPTDQNPADRTQRDKQDAPSRKWLASASYDQSCAWIIARLAEGLHHAHERGICHRDIKPANILLAGDGQPMLLDFNLADNVGFLTGKTPTGLGGTITYMAPEHLRALATRDVALVQKVDHRADIYSLGLVLFEMLTGREPFESDTTRTIVPRKLEALAIERNQMIPSAKKLRPSIPWALESILAKCLRPNPEHRYQRGSQLAEDLTRFLNQKTLLHAPELCWRDVAMRWVARNRRSLSITMATVGSLLLMCALALVVRESQLQLEKAHAAELRDQHSRFDRAYQKTLCFLNVSADLKNLLPEGIASCTEGLAIFGVNDLSSSQVRPVFRGMTDVERTTIQRQMGEMLRLLAQAKVRSGTNRAAFLEGLRLLNLADQIQQSPPSRSILELKADWNLALGETAEAKRWSKLAETAEANSIGEAYWQANRLAHLGRYSEAETELDKAVVENPKDFWAFLLRGICREEQQKFALAHGDYSACVALWPEFSWGWFNRGRMLETMGERSAAISDYGQALARDANSIPILLNRGLAFLAQGKAIDAISDFRRVRDLGTPSVHLFASLGLAHEQLGQTTEADHAFEQAWAIDPENAHYLLAFAFAVHQRDPERAQATFHRVLRKDEKNAKALYGLGMLETRRNRFSAEAARFFARALEADPAFLEARRARANVLAHQGNWKSSREDIDWCAKMDPSGATLYSAACVYALNAQFCTDSAWAEWFADRALDWLDQAIQKGYGRDLVETDTDLNAIRNRPEFKRFEANAKTGA